MFVLASVVAAALNACSGSAGVLVSLELTAPSDGAALSPDDDENRDLPGTQITVSGHASGVSGSLAFSLWVDDTRVAISAPDADGALAFEEVTLPPGRHDLIARAFDGSVESATTEYTLRGLAITDPIDGTTLSASADEDPNTADFQRSITVQSYGLDLADTISLRIDDAEVAMLNPAADGSVVFPRQTFSAGDHTLQVTSGTLASEAVTISIRALCPRVDWITPDLARDGSPVTLGPDDDTLGPGCGEEFALDVVVATDAGDGAMLTLLVNGSTRATANVDGTVARFSGVVLGNRGSMANRLAIELPYENTTCRSELPNNLFVDCEGASCEITSPNAPNFLGLQLDRSLEPGFQGQFQVTTDTTAIGRAVALIVDGDALNSRRSLPVAQASSAIATFSVSLGEGPHRMIALCTDTTGNVTASGQRTWTVDTTPCNVTITAPRNGAFFLDSDDVDNAEGTQIDVIASVTGSDCERGRAGVCGGLQGLPLLPISGSSPVSRVTLSTNASQSICYEVADRAGNYSQAQTQVFFDTDAPQLSIREPAHGTRFNVLGNTYQGLAFEADLLPLTAPCDVAFEVQCSDLETDVTLHEYVSGVAIPQATAPCDPASAPTPELPGIARFDNVALPRLGTVALFARQLAAGGRLIGVSAPITLTEDCQAPTLTISSGDDPLCGAELGPSLSDPGGTSITRDVSVTSDDSANVGEVRLRVMPVAGGAPIADVTDSDAPFLFDNVNFSAFGSHDVVLDAVDQAGNVAIAPSCRVSVVDAPAVAISVSESGDSDNVIEAEDDCSADVGMQVQISATTNAPQGAAVSLTVGGVIHDSSVACAGSACGFELCVDAPEGHVLVRAQITDPNKPTTGVVEQQVLIDSLLPTSPIADLTVEAASEDALRAGAVVFRWSDVADQGDIALTSYALRCDATPISDESAWTAATPIGITLTPGTPGSQRSLTVAGFALYETRHCVLRGLDAAGALTPLAPTAATIDFLALRTQRIDGESDEGIGRALAAIGDVNGDGFLDVLAGGIGVGRVYFGQSDLSMPTRTLTIAGPSDDFGEQVAGLGDINGDGTADFAVSDPDAAVVYIYLGRRERGPSPDPMWPSQLDALIDTAITLRSANGDRFGHALAAAGDVNDDGLADFAIGAPEHDTDAGRVHVVLGRPLCTMDVTEHCLLLGSTTTLGTSGGGVDGYVIDGAPSTRFGMSFAAIGDVNGDARDDLAIGAPGSISAMIDATLYALPGTPYGDNDSGLLPLDLAALVGTRLADPEQSGHMIAALRSLAGTRVAVMRDNEVAIVEWTTPLGSATLSDEVRIPNDLGDSSDAWGGSLGTGLVPSLPAVDCDLDRDGLDELFVGSAGRMAAPGSSELFYRAPLLARRDNTQAAPRSSAEWFSASTAGPIRVACVGDVNGDGEADLLASDAADNDNAGAILFYY